MVYQSHTYNQLCDIGSGKDGTEVHILSLVRNDFCKKVPHMNLVSLEDTVQHEKISV